VQSAHHAGVGGRTNLCRLRLVAFGHGTPMDAVGRAWRLQTRPYGYCTTAPGARSTPATPAPWSDSHATTKPSAWHTANQPDSTTPRTQNSRRQAAVNPVFGSVAMQGQFDQATNRTWESGDSHWNIAAFARAFGVRTESLLWVQRFRSCLRDVAKTLGAESCWLGRRHPVSLLLPTGVRPQASRPRPPHRSRRVADTDQRRERQSPREQVALK
jgi:hypothetical protein